MLDSTISALIDKISFEDLKKILPTFKKPTFKSHQNICRIGELLNSYGSYEAFINATEHSKYNDEDEDMHILKYLYDDYSTVLPHYCLCGKIGYFKFIRKYVQWCFKYFISRKDLNLTQRTYITAKKSLKYVYRFNYDTIIDLKDYYAHKDKYNDTICNLFKNKQIDRLNLYRYTIVESVEEFHNRIRNM